MGLNIKNARVHELAREAARVTGKSQTAAIEEALELLLRAYDEDPDAARIARKVEVVRELVAAYGATPGNEDREIRVVADLYDADTGLPR